MVKDTLGTVPYKHFISRFRGKKELRRHSKRQRNGPMGLTVSLTLEQLGVRGIGVLPDWLKTNVLPSV